MLYLQRGGHLVRDYSNNKRKEPNEEKTDRVDKGKKLGTFVGLVPDVIVGKDKEEVSESLRARGKVCD